VTLNVLVFDEELPLVEERIRQMAQAGVDAVIVQVSQHVCLQLLLSLDTGLALMDGTDGG
jgi:hypothetical protein